ACFQVIGDTQHDLGVVEGLGDEVARAQLERCFPGAGGDVGGQHQNRHQILLRDQQLQFGEQLETVHVRHVKIEKNDVGGGGDNCLGDETGIANELDVAKAPLVQECLEQGQVRGLVVDHQNAGTVNLFRDHVCGSS